MLRRSRVWRVARPQSGDKDRERIYRERQRRMVYDERGNLRFYGLCTVLWEEFGFSIKVLLAAAACTYAYQKLVVVMCEYERSGAVALDKMSESIARESGKLKGDQYLVKPRRQIEDPDMYNVPSFSGKTEVPSKLFQDPTYSSGKLIDEYAKSK